MADVQLPNPFSIEGAKRISQITGQSLATSPIDASTLSGGSTIQTPTLPTPPTPTPSSIVLPPIQNTAEQDVLKGKQDDLLGDIEVGTKTLGTKSARKNELETAQGIPQLNKDIQELYDQATALDAASVQAKANSEDRLAPMFAITGEQAQIERQTAAKKAGIAAIASAKTGKLALAQDYVTKALAAEFDPIEKEIENKKFLLTINMDSFSTEEKRRAEQRLEELSTQKEAVADARTKRDKVLEIMLSAAAAGASNTTLTQIQNASTPEEATAIAGSVLGSKFLADMTQQQFDNDIKQKQLKISQDNHALDAAKFAYEKAKSAPNTATLTTVADLTTALKSGTIGQGTRTQVSNVMGVFNSLQDLANARSDGKFEGFSPIGGLTGSLASTAAIENRSYLDAINLKVQQWASGASLTKQQIDQVNRMTPTARDTDRVIKTKMNSLANFMLTQAQSQLQSEGITYTPTKIELFKPASLDEIMNP